MIMAKLIWAAVTRWAAKERKGEANKKPKNRLGTAHTHTHKKKRKKETIIIADKDICDARLPGCCVSSSRHYRRQKGNYREPEDRIRPNKKKEKNKNKNTRKSNRHAQQIIKIRKSLAILYYDGSVYAQRISIE
jgi:hypothetical protein